MTRKDYELIARALQASLPDDPVWDTHDLAVAHRQRGRTVHCIADALAADNPRFDREGFLAACGVGA